MKWGGCKKVENGVFCREVENAGCFVKNGKWGVFCKKVGKGVVFVKMWTFPQCRVHYTVSVFFIFYFTYLGGGAYAGLLSLFHSRAGFSCWEAWGPLIYGPLSPQA